MTRAQAAEILRTEGMAKLSTSPFSDLKREYWGYTDGRKNVFLDHSATITKVGAEWLISDFTSTKAE